MPKTPPKKGIRLIPAKSPARQIPIPIAHRNVPRVCNTNDKAWGPSAYESEGRRFESCRARHDHVLICRTFVSRSPLFRWGDFGVADNPPKKDPKYPQNTVRILDIHRIPMYSITMKQTSIEENGMQTTEQQIWTTPETLESLRQALIAESETDKAEYPQYRGNWNDWRPVEAVAFVKTKFGAALKPGEVVLASPEIRDNGAFVMIYSRSNKIDTSVPASAIREIEVRV